MTSINGVRSARSEFDAINVGSFVEYRDGVTGGAAQMRVTFANGFGVSAVRSTEANVRSTDTTYEVGIFDARDGGKRFFDSRPYQTAEDVEAICAEVAAYAEDAEAVATWFEA